MAARGQPWHLLRVSPPIALCTMRLPRRCPLAGSRPGKMASDPKPMARGDTAHQPGSTRKMLRGAGEGGGRGGAPAVGGGNGAGIARGGSRKVAPPLPFEPLDAAPPPARCPVAALGEDHE